MSRRQACRASSILLPPRPSQRELYMSPGQPVLETKALTKKYGKFVALDGLTLSVERGEILGFVGPNGAGKTTTIKILVGLARPTSGSARIAGVDCVAEARKIKRLVGRGTTLLVTSHVLPELARVCHRVAIITRGRLRAIGTLEEISRQLSQLRPMEVLLTHAAQIDRVVELVRQHIESGAEITSSPAEAVVRFRTAQREEELAGLLSALVAAGLGVAQFREVQTDLEEAFVA